MNRFPFANAFSCDVDVPCALLSSSGAPLGPKAARAEHQ